MRCARGAAACRLHDRRRGAEGPSVRRWRRSCRPSARRRRRRSATNSPGTRERTAAKPPRLRPERERLRSGVGAERRARPGPPFAAVPRRRGRREMGGSGPHPPLPVTASRRWWPRSSGCSVASRPPTGVGGCRLAHAGPGDAGAPARGVRGAARRARCGDRTGGGARRPGRLGLHARPAGHERPRGMPLDRGQGGTGEGNGGGEGQVGAARRPSSHSMLEGDAYADGGDRFWLDDTTAAVGLGYRTNRAGADALQALLAGAAPSRPTTCRMTGFELVLHLQSFLSAATEECSWSTSRSRPSGCCRTSRRAGSSWIAIDKESYDAMGCNILGGPSIVVMVEGRAEGAEGAAGPRCGSPHLRWDRPLAQGRQRGDPSLHHCSVTDSPETFDDLLAAQGSTPANTPSRGSRPRRSRSPAAWCAFPPTTCAGRAGRATRRGPPPRPAARAATATAGSGGGSRPGLLALRAGPVLEQAVRNLDRPRRTS